MSTTDIVAPDEQAIIAEVNATVVQARAIEVATPVQAQGAVEFLARLADAKKRNEAARVFIVGPLNKQIKAINDRFKENAVPLDEADQVVREKLLAYQEQEQQRVAAEQARIDEERRAREAAVEAERRQQAEAAAAAERAAREAEQARQAQLREAANERARELSMMSDDELAAIAGVMDPGPDARLAGEELVSRKAAREAQERADVARREAEEAQQREIAAKSAPAALATVTPLSAASGSASTSKRWTGTVIDDALVPREYLVVDQKAINAAVRQGVREIPGVRIEQTTGLSVRAGR